LDIYGGFASVYDVMQYDIDYDLWSDKMQSYINKYRPRSEKILEIACGTGTLTVKLSEKGFVMHGVDMSEDMLAIANKKSRDAGQMIRYFHQNMVELNTKHRYDACVCLCDGINYLIDQDDLKKTVANVYDHLNQAGLFIFDISSYYKLSEIIGNETFAETFADTAYIWENEFDLSDSILRFDLTLFKSENKVYKRYEEYHEQKAYTIEEIKTSLRSCFEIIEMRDGDTFESVNKTSQRICFICRKKDEEAL